MLTRSLNKTLGVKNSSKRKKFFQQGCLLSLDSLADGEKFFYPVQKRGYSGYQHLSTGRYTGRHHRLRICYYALLPASL